MTNSEVYPECNKWQRVISKYSWLLFCHFDVLQLGQPLTSDWYNTNFDIINYFIFFKDILITYKLQDSYCLDSFGYCN